MGFAEFATVLLKTFAIGFIVALVASTTGFFVSGSRSDLLAALPRGITKSVLAALLIFNLTQHFFYAEENSYLITGSYAAMVHMELPEFYGHNN